jgi:hypothetical protein
VVLVVGTSLEWASEGHDATQINFTAAQSTLIDRTAAAAKKPIVLLLMTAVPLDISKQLGNPKVGPLRPTSALETGECGASNLLFVCGRRG